MGGSLIHLASVKSSLPQKPSLKAVSLSSMPVPAASSLIRKAIERKSGLDKPRVRPVPIPEIIPFRNIKSMKQLRTTVRRSAGAFLALAVLGIVPALVFAAEIALPKINLSGYVKSFNFFTRTSGMNPEQVDQPLLLTEKNEKVFSNLNRIRLKVKSTMNVTDTQKVTVKIDYDHQAYFGTFQDSQDFRIMKKQVEQRQFLDMSQTLVEDEDGYYEHRLYRASVMYSTEWGDVEVGRQQIPWGVGHFFTPTDLFNPFNPTQLELDERDGVDAVNITSSRFDGFKTQLVFTPPGRELHPQRYLARISRDVKGYEVGVLGGRIKRDHTVGFDLAGNLKDSAIRGEFLYREAELEKDFIKFTVNADYNFPLNIHALLEYHFNGQGRRDPDDYQRDRILRGEIYQAGKNYLALLLDYDITPLLRFENRTIFNMDDVSFYIRPELQYELRSNFLITAGMQLFAGDKKDELGAPNHLFFGEGKYSF